MILLSLITWMIHRVSPIFSVSPHLRPEGDEDERPIRKELEEQKDGVESCEKSVGHRAGQAATHHAAVAQRAVQQASIAGGHVGIVVQQEDAHDRTQPELLLIGNSMWRRLWLVMAVELL